jgi:hypothetical protein
MGMTEGVTGLSSSSTPAPGAGDLDFLTFFTFLIPLAGMNLFAPSFNNLDLIPFFFSTADHRLYQGFFSSHISLVSSSDKVGFFWERLAVV